MEEENLAHIHDMNTIGLKQYVDDNNKLHRTDGPAVLWTMTIGDRIPPNGYYIHGKHMTREEFVMWYEVAFLKEYEGV